MGAMFIINKVRRKQLIIGALAARVHHDEWAAGSQAATVAPPASHTADVVPAWLYTGHVWHEEPSANDERDGKHQQQHSSVSSGGRRGCRRHLATATCPHALTRVLKLGHITSPALVSLQCIKSGTQVTTPSSRYAHHSSHHATPLLPKSATAKASTAVATPMTAVSSGANCHLLLRTLHADDEAGHERHGWRQARVRWAWAREPGAGTGMTGESGRT